jgi:RimJ/RimL family protein N-acetyltransferase
VLVPTLDDLTWPVRTERLTIRRLRPEDADAVAAYRSDPALMTWQAGLLADAAAFVRDFEGWTAQNLAVEHEGSLVGDVHLRVHDAWTQAEAADRGRDAQAELGWTLSRAAQGRGFGREAGEAMLAIAFEGLGVRRVVGECFVANAASWRLMEALGMRREAHHVRDGLHAELGWIDGYLYALLAEEWKATRG